jgi:hypothetical protein
MRISESHISSEALAGSESAEIDDDTDQGCGWQYEEDGGRQIVVRSTDTDGVEAVQEDRVDSLQKVSPNF